MMTEEEHRGFVLSEERRLMPRPYEVYIIVLYTVKEINDYLAYRATNKEGTFTKLIVGLTAADVLGGCFPDLSRCIILDDGSLILYIPIGAHTNANRLTRDFGIVATQAAMHVANATGTDLETSWVTFSHLVGYMQAHLMAGVGSYSGNNVAMVNPLVKNFDNHLYHYQIKSAMAGMSPLECQQALYRQNIARQNHVVMPTLQSWVSTTYF